MRALIDQIWPMYCIRSDAFGPSTKVQYAVLSHLR